MPKVSFYDRASVDDTLFKYAVIASRYNGKWIYCKHKDRDTWEIPGGHREEGEYIDDTARRELYEETGAVKFNIAPVCAYSVTNKAESFGMLYYGEIEELSHLPQLEIEKIELFDSIPTELTYPLIQPKLVKRVEEFLEKESP